MAANKIEELVHHIISSEDIEKTSEEWTKKIHPLFITDRLPNGTYKEFLWFITNHLHKYNANERHNIYLFLMRCEEGAYYFPVTGIMRIYPDDPIYNKYDAILSAVYDKNNPCPFKNADKSVDLCNSTIIMLLTKIQKGCAYGNKCKRDNWLHKKLFHERSVTMKSKSRSRSPRTIKSKSRSRSRSRSRSKPRSLNRHHP